MPTRKIEFLITAKNATKKAFGAVERNLKGLSKQAAIAASKLGAVFGIGAAAGVGVGIRNFLRDVEDLANTATKLSTTTEFLSEVGFVAKQAGISLSAFQTSLQRMARRAQEAAQGTGTAVNAFKELGIDIEKFNKLSLEEKLRTIAEAFKTNANATNELRLAMALFDTEGVNMVNILRDGAAALDLNRENAKAFGASIGGEDVEAVKRFNQQLDALNAKLGAIGRTFATPTIAGANRVLSFFGLGSPSDAAAEIKELEYKITAARDRIIKAQENYKKYQDGMSPFTREMNQKRITEMYNELADLMKRKGKIELSFTVDPKTGEQLNAQVQALIKPIGITVVPTGIGDVRAVPTSVFNKSSTSILWDNVDTELDKRGE